jgi:hypothetical protein
MISSLATKTVKVFIGTIVGGFFILFLAVVGQPEEIVNMVSKWDFEGLPIR